MNLSETFFKARKERKISQRTVAKLLEEQGIVITQAQLSNIETGNTKNPTFEIVVGLAKIFELDINELIKDMQSNETVS